MMTVDPQLICGHCQAAMTMHFAPTPPYMPTGSALHTAGMTQEKVDNTFLPRALRNLRLNGGLSQQIVAERLKMSKQAYSKYELGQARISEVRRAEILQALEVSEDEVFAEMRRVADKQGVELSRSEMPWHAHFPDNLRAFRIQDEDMSPWAEPNEIIFFEVGRYPGRSEGAILEMNDGRTLLRLYERTDGSSYFMRRLQPLITETIPLSEVRAIHRVALRGRN